MAYEFIPSLRIVANQQIIDIPFEISKEFPTRGMVMAQVNFYDFEGIVPIEPNGLGGHWLQVPNEWGDSELLIFDSSEKMKIKLLSQWPDPVLPNDFKDALESTCAIEPWSHITPKAKWEWIRWIRSTTQESTRKKRIHIACDKLLKGDRRPCCFDSSSCTVTGVSKSGKLL